MAATKSRRSNAGNLMQKLIEDEVDDDFYKSTYGGFDEEECDNDYESEEEVDDVVDSDFSIEEQDDEKSDDEDDRPKKRKKMVVKTFKTPKAKTETAPKNDGVKKAKVTKPKQESSPVKMEERKKTFRSSTLLKTEHSIVTNIATPKKKNPKQPELRRLTQEELLAEAKITAEKNIASLAAFLKLEAEKKKTKLHKVRHQGPVIRFHSVTMPLVEEIDSEMPDDANTTPETDAFSSVKKCSRNFLVFTDVNNFPSKYFPSEKNLEPEKPVCVITGLPAKYKDPLTGFPYATAEAFKLIRADHKSRLVAKGQKRQSNERARRKTEKLIATNLL